jgi:hypothetical protein
VSGQVHVPANLKLYVSQFIRQLCGSNSRSLDKKCPLSMLEMDQEFSVVQSVA